MIIYTTSTEYKKEIKNPSRNFECRVTIGDKIYTNDEVQSIDLNGGIQDVFSIGNTPSICLDLVLRNTSDTIYNMIPINVEIGLNINNKIEYIPLGIFNIADVKKDDFTIKITAYDNMSKFKVPYFSSLGNTATLTQVANEIAAKTGVQFEGTLPNYSVKKLEGFSCREVLGFIASLCGGNAIIKRNGKFTIVYPTDINRDIGEGVFDFTREEVKYKIGKITCKVEDKTLSKGSLGADSMEMQFENPWMNEAILTDIYKRLNGFEYLGYTLKWQGDPSLDIGDIITYKDDRGVIRKLPIFNRKLSYDGGLDSELFAKGETKNKNSFDSSGSMKKKIDRVVTELAIVNEALIDVAYIGDLTAGNIKFDTASGTIMDLQTLLAKFVSGENGQFLNLTTDNVTISNAVIKDIIAKNMSVGDLKAGKISTNKFTVASDDGGITIVGPTMQFKDKSNKVRIQMGQDTQGNFNFILRGADGTTTLIDHTGIKEKAIADNLIKEKMIAENAVGEKQINYSSLVTGLNKDTNTSLIKASKVAIDLTGQSLEVAFNTLKTNVDNTQIGGRNYIRDYQFKSEAIWGKSRTEAKVDVINGYGYLTRSTANPYLYQELKHADIKNGDTLTLQYEIKFENVGANTGSNTFIIRSILTAYLNGIGLKGDVCTFGRHESDGLYTNDGWQKVVKTLTINTKLEFDFLMFRLYARNFTGAIYFRNVKLEKGNKATDLSEAPEDASEKIEANTTSISAIQGNIETLIKDTTIEKDGETTKLKDAYSALTQTVEGFKTTVSENYTTKTEHSDLNKNVSGLINRVNTAESKLTATSLTTTISSAINAGTNSITTTQFVMDKNGLTIKNGAIKIQNKAGTNVFASDTNGNLTITGTFINKNSNGVKAIEINNTNIYFYDWERSGRELGIIYSSYLTDYPNVRGFSLAHNQQGYMTLGYRKETNTFGHYMTFDKYAKNPTYAAPIRVHEGTVFHQAVNMQDRVYIPSQLVFDKQLSSLSPRIFKNASDSRNILAVQVSVNAKDDGFMIQSNTGSVLFGIQAGYNYPVYSNTSMQVSGNFTVTGSKNSLQATEHYGERLINAYETAEYYFGDIGSGVINSDGECVVYIDEILQECINTDIEYHVFTQLYNGSITKIERHKNYFIVYGENETEFSWELKAKRIGYENVRLDSPDIQGYLDDIPNFTEDDLSVKTSEEILNNELDFKLEDILMEG